jgi:hypothetical protein
MGRLEIGDNDLAIYGTAIARRVALGEVRVTRDGTNAVRLSTGVLAVRVSIIGSDGTELEPYFAALARRRVREALRDRGWPRFDGIRHPPKQPHSRRCILQPHESGRVP